MLAAMLETLGCVYEVRRPVLMVTDKITFLQNQSGYVYHHTMHIVLGPYPALTIFPLYKSQIITY
jgi:hypothetical protein